MKHVELGDEVRDNITGLKGVAIGITRWLNGCIRVGVQPSGLKDGKPIEAQWIDEPQLKIVKRQKVAGPKEEPGGPKPTPQRQRDPRR